MCPGGHIFIINFEQISEIVILHFIFVSECYFSSRQLQSCQINDRSRNQLSKTFGNFQDIDFS